jgi:hypothetical protein
MKKCATKEHLEEYANFVRQYQDFGFLSTCQKGKQDIELEKKLTLLPDEKLDAIMPHGPSPYQHWTDIFVKWCSYNSSLPESVVPEGQDAVSEPFCFGK